MISDIDKQKIVNHLSAYLVSLSDFTFHNKAYEKRLKTELRDLIKSIEWYLK